MRRISRCDLDGIGVALLEVECHWESTLSFWKPKSGIIVAVVFKKQKTKKKKNTKMEGERFWKVEIDLGGTMGANLITDCMKF